MNRMLMLFSVAVLVGLLLTSGCSSNFAKGEGSILETHLIIGRSPMSHQWAVNNALRKDTGPAEIVSTHSLVDPNPRVAEISSSMRREARD